MSIPTRVSPVYHRTSTGLFVSSAKAKAQAYEHYYARAGYQTSIRKVGAGYAIYSRGAYSGVGSRTRAWERGEVARLRRGDL